MWPASLGNHSGCAPVCYNWFMGEMLNDKRIRQLAIAVLLVILALGLLSLVSTVFQMIVPLAIVIGGAFAFYKIVLEGRNESEAMEDEIAESASADATLRDGAYRDASADMDADEAEAQQRLSVVERARSEFLESATPAEEILDQLKSRQRRLQGDDET